MREITLRIRAEFDPDRTNETAIIEAIERAIEQALIALRPDAHGPVELELQP